MMAHCPVGQGDGDVTSAVLRGFQIYKKKNQSVVYFEVVCHVQKIVVLTFGKTRTLYNFK